MTISERIKTLCVMKGILRHKITVLICIAFLLLCVAVVWIILSAPDGTPGNDGSSQPNGELTTTGDMFSSATDRTETSGNASAQGNFATTAGATVESTGNPTKITSDVSATGSGSVRSTTVASFGESTTTSFSTTTSTSKVTATVATNILENAGEDTDGSFGKLY